MIRYRIDERLDEVRDWTGRRPSFTEIQEATGVSVSVLSNMRTKVGYVTTTRTIDALCRYFECQPGDLMQWRPDPDGGGGLGLREDG
jgi:putative transcriptional regulator